MEQFITSNQYRLHRAGWLVMLLLMWLSSTAHSAATRTDLKRLGQLASNVEAVQGTTASTGKFFYTVESYPDNAIDLSAYVDNEANLLLTANVYVFDMDNPSKILFLEDDATVVSLEIGNSRTVKATWNAKTLNLKPGWNEISVPFSAIKTRHRNFTLSSAIGYFRFSISRIKEKDNYKVRVYDAYIRDKSRTETITEDPVYDTTYDVCSLPYSFDATISAGKGTWVSKEFSQSYDITKHNFNKLYLAFDAEITPTIASEVSYLNGNGQIELTSSGKCDVNEATFDVASVNWKAGKHTYYVPLITASASGGGIDWSAINYMRLYLVDIPSSMKGSIRWKLDNVHIVDFADKTSLPTLFSDGMMFQQNKPINIWGYGLQGKNISVELFRGSTSLGKKEVSIDETGKWMVSYPAQVGSYDKYHFTVYEDGSLLQEVNDILVGEVWIAAGQSNMQLPVRDLQNRDEVLAGANNDNIRFFIEPTKPTGDISPYEREKDVMGGYWGHGDNPGNVRNVSAVAYYMVRNLQPRLGVPVGFLYTPIGGSFIEAWLPREVIETPENAALKVQLMKQNMYYDKYSWKNAPEVVTGFYNAKIGPLEGFGVAGVIWYQGENNSGHPELYAQELYMLKSSWEKNLGFEKGQMPFVYTEVAPWVEKAESPYWLGLLAEAMADGYKKISDSKTGFFPIYDTNLDYTGNAVIHPTDKAGVGNRFASVVYNMMYGHEGKEYVCPQWESATVKGDKMVVKFSHVGEGLKTIDGTQDVHGFALAGANGIYMGAQAQITGKDEVTVWNRGLKNPQSVTYAFQTFNIGSTLANSENLPAAPFRSVRVDDKTTMQKNYYNPQDWTYADAAQTWVISAEKKNYLGDIYDYYTGYMDAWKNNTVSGDVASTLTFDTEVKAEGKASLKVSYPSSADGKVGVGPVTNYKSCVLQLVNYKYLSVMVKNGDNRAKTLLLQLKTPDGVYTVDAAQGGNNVQVAAGADFADANFCLTSLKDATGAAVADVASVLQKVTDLQFTINDTAAGTIYLDNVMFGMSEPVSTGIQAVVGKGAQSAQLGHWINLLGQEVTVPRGGIYVHQGKKMVVR